MNRIIPVAAVLFDLDGVLADSTAAIERHWRQWAAKHSVDPEEILRLAHGRRAVDTIRLVAPTLDAEAEMAFLAKEDTADLEGVVLIDGAGKLTAALPSERWGIVTSGTREVAEARLRHVGIAQPRVLICAEMVSRGKPDPEGYCMAASHLGFAARDCLVIEDSPAGLEAAHTAGMLSIAVCTTHDRRQLGSATTIVDHLDEINPSFEDGRVVLHLA